MIPGYINETTRKAWPRFAVHPEYGRARFDCAGDMPPGYVLEIPLTPEQIGHTPGTVSATVSAKDEEIAELRKMVAELSRDIKKMRAT